MQINYYNYDPTYNLAYQYKLFEITILRIQSKIRNKITGIWGVTNRLLYFSVHINCRYHIIQLRTFCTFTLQKKLTYYKLAILVFKVFKVTGQVSFTILKNIRLYSASKKGNNFTKKFRLQINNKTLEVKVYIYCIIITSACIIYILSQANQINYYVNSLL